MQRILHTRARVAAMTMNTPWPFSLSCSMFSSYVSQVASTCIIQLHSRQVNNDKHNQQQNGKEQQEGGGKSVIAFFAAISLLLLMGIRIMAVQFEPAVEPE